MSDIKTILLVDTFCGIINGRFYFTIMLVSDSIAAVDRWHRKFTVIRRYLVKEAGRAEFTKAMKSTHTILLPDMLHYHNALLQAAFASCGYHLEILPEEKNLPGYSLPYISNDYCFPTVLILGQVLAAVQSGRFQPDRIAFMEPQTGGACRAGNIYNSIIESLKRAGYGQIPVISLNAFGEYRHEGFTITPKLLFSAVAAVCFGDLLMTLYQQVRPYECRRGEAKECWERWNRKLCEDIRAGKSISRKKRMEQYRRIVYDFSQIPVEDRNIRRVGITGEIYIKFSPIGNEHLEELLQEQDCAYRMGGFINYAIYTVDSELENQRLCGAGRTIQKVYDMVIRYLLRIQHDINQSIVWGNRFLPDADFPKMKEMAAPIIDRGCHTGDGWLVAAEVADLAEKGCDNILIVHPFGCLVSHVCERGIMKKLHERYPDVNIQTVEYDYDSARALRESRILLGISGKNSVVAKR